MSSPLRPPTPSKADTATTDTATTPTAATGCHGHHDRAPPPAAVRPRPQPPAKPSRSRPPATSRRRISRSPTNCATCSAAKSLRYFDRKAERAAVEKFYTARDFAPLWTQGGALTETGKGVIARLKDAASDGLNAADYPVPDFAAATKPDALAEADLKLTASMLDYARQAQSGRMHWSQVSRRHLLSRASDRSDRSAGQCHDRQGRLRGARQLQPAAEALPGTEGEARRIARPGRRPGDPDRGRPGAEIHAGARQEAARGRDGRSARAAAARQARHHRERRRHPLRRQGRRGRAQIPGRRRTQGHRRARRPAPSRPSTARSATSRSTP